MASTLPPPSSSAAPALAANMSLVVGHMRELYVHNLAVALAERAASTSRNWEQPRTGAK